MRHASGVPSVASMTDSKNAIITGASRGLGLALARGLAEDGYSLVLDARDGEALRAAAASLQASLRHGQAGVTVTAVPGDIADPGAPRRSPAGRRPARRP